MSESIVVGTDGSDSAGRAVDEALRLAHALGAELHVVSGYEPLRRPAVEGRLPGGVKDLTPLPDTSVNATVEEAAAKARARGMEVYIHPVKLDPADALLAVADEVGASLIVVGSKGMHGAKRFVLGSVPNTVSHRARCNVLIVSTEQP